MYFVNIEVPWIECNFQVKYMSILSNFFLKQSVFGTSCVICVLNVSQLGWHTVMQIISYDVRYLATSKWIISAIHDTFYVNYVLTSKNKFTWVLNIFNWLFCYYLPLERDIWINVNHLQSRMFRVKFILNWFIGSEEEFYFFFIF